MPISCLASAGWATTSIAPTWAEPDVGSTRVVSIPAVVVLPAPFGPEQPEDLPRVDLQVQVVDGCEVGARVDLRQLGGADDGLRPARRRSALRGGRRGRRNIGCLQTAHRPQCIRSHCGVPARGWLSPATVMLARGSDGGHSRNASAGSRAGGAGAERPSFEIVPRKGLIAVAVVLALVIAAIAANKLWPLAFLHFVGGASWTIIDLFLGFVLGPIMGQLSIPARVEFTTRLMPKMVLIMPTVVTATLAAGWQLGVHLGTVQSSYYHHGWTVASFIVVGVMAVIALGLLEPANIAVLVELKKPRPNPAVIEQADETLHLHAPGATGA